MFYGGSSMSEMRKFTGEGTHSQKKQRDSNLELFRIVTMLLIVAHHYVVNSGLMAANGPIRSSAHSLKSLSLLLFGAFGKTGINCFVLITGYFMCRSNITARKFAKLVFEFMFYRIVIYLIFAASGYTAFSSDTFIKTVIPIKTINTNFTNCFTVFWLFIPFLNILIDKMNERQHVRLVFLSTSLYVLLGSFGQVTMNYVSWFIVLYFVASYIRLYPKKCFENTKLWGLLTVLCVAASSATVILSALYGKKTTNFYAYVSDSNKVLAVTTAVCAFMFFKNLKIKHNRFINTVAASTFGVLCIHASSNTMRRWLWRDTLNNVGNYKSALMPVHAVGSVIGVFAVCTVIDIIRINLIEKPFFRLWDKHWDGFCSRFKRAEDKLFCKFHIGEDK